MLQHYVNRRFTLISISHMQTDSPTIYISIFLICKLEVGILWRARYRMMQMRSEPSRSLKQVEDICVARARDTFETHAKKYAFVIHEKLYADEKSVYFSSTYTLWNFRLINIRTLKMQA